MANPFRAAMGGSNGPQTGKRNFAPALLQHIQGFRGNPIQELQSKLSSGEMTQDQYDQLHSAAERIVGQMMGLLGRK